MGKIRYSEIVESIDVDAFEAAIGFEPRSHDRGWDNGFCVWPDNHTHGDTTGKFGINRDSRTYNCVPLDTLIQTDGGLRRAGSLIGRTVNVLTQDGTYHPAQWYEYGKQEIYRINLDNGDVLYATGDHQWVISRSGNARWQKPERVTTRVLQGERIPFQSTTQSPHSIDYRGVQHGLVYGDGTMTSANTCRVDQFGDENCLLLEDFFGDVQYIPHTHMIHARVSRIQGRFKIPPSLDSPVEYLRGFLAGLLAADGNVSSGGKGSVKIHQANRAALEHVRLIAAACGIATYPIRIERKTNPWTGDDAPLYSLGLSKTGMRCQRDLLLKLSHRNHLDGSGPTRNRVSAKVVSVMATGRYEPVACCVEPITHTMVIGPGYLTGQCYVCGGGSFLSLAMELYDFDVDEATTWLSQFASGDTRDDDQFKDYLLELLSDVEERRATMPYFNPRVLERFNGPRDYFRTRGISDEIIEQYRLCYGEQVMKPSPVKVGRDGVRAKQDDDYYGPTSVFPHYWGDRLVGWQHRWMDWDQDRTKVPRWLAKYTNTTDFPKSNTLFNYDAALKARQPIVVCESVPTVLFLASYDIPAVSYFGAKPTPAQLRLMRRFGQGVILAPDNDSNGDTLLNVATPYLERFIPVRHAAKVDLGPKADLGDYAKCDEPYRELRWHLDKLVRTAGVKI